MTPQSRVCTRCHEDKPFDHFYNAKKGKWGKSSICIPCDRAKGASYFKKRYEDPDFRERKSRMAKERYQRQKELRGEHVYVLTNKAFPGLCKIGRSKDPKDRLSTYNAGDPHRSYEFFRIVEVNDQNDAEKEAHRMLDAKRVEGTEWFKITPERAAAILERFRHDTQTNEEIDND